MLNLEAPREESTEIPHHREVFETLKARVEDADQRITAFRGKLLPRFFSYLPLTIVMLVIGIAGAVLVFTLGFTTNAVAVGGGTVVALLGLAFLIYRVSMSRARPDAEAIVGSLAEARRLHDLCGVAGQAFHSQERQRVQKDYEYLCAEIEAHWSHAGEAERELSR
jgi:hypothetical protein